MANLCEVVITGIGVVSPIGIGKDAFWESLRGRASGVKPFSLLQDTEVPVRFGAEVGDFDPKQHVKPRKSLKVMSREIQIGFAAAALAIEDARLACEQLDHDRFGVLFGSELFYSRLDELEGIYRSCIAGGRFDFDRWGERAMNDIFPLWLLKYLPNMVACHIGIANDARGPNNTITLGEASSLLALIESVRVIQRGHADVMIAGGTGSRLNLTAIMYRGDSNLSHRSDDPAAASRPFDGFRDGMVNGEGAGAFILESHEHAAARGAKRLARVLGCGGSHDSRLNGRPSGDAIRHAILGALRDADISPRDVGHVNANGLSTMEDDPLEAQAIQACLGDVAVTAPKSFFGNLGAGGGAVEAAASVLAFQHGEVPVTLNYERPDPNCPVNVIHERPEPVSKPIAVAVNQSGTGQAAAVVLAGP